MKKLTILFLSVILVFSFTGCNKNFEKQSEKLQVYTSFYTMYDFTQKIGSDKINVKNLVPAGTEPHDYEPTTSDIVNLEKADLIVYNGAGMEHWIDKVLGTLNNKDIYKVEASKGVNIINETGEKTVDPHVWLDPKNAEIELENIKNGLISVDPSNKSFYENNYEYYKLKLDELDAEYKERISKLPNKNIVVSHKAYSYLCNSYGLNQIAIDGISADSEPDAERMAEIINFCRENNVKTIFFEELVSPKIAQTIANEVGAKTAVLNPLEGLSDEDISNGEDYFSIMRKNLAALEEALG